jgi:hypothetical protein
MSELHLMVVRERLKRAIPSLPNIDRVRRNRVVNLDALIDWRFGSADEFLGTSGQEF